MKSIDEIRQELKEESAYQPTPVPLNRQLPPSRTLPRIPGSVAPIVPDPRSIIVDEATRRVMQADMMSNYPRAAGPDHDWGYNRVTGVKIRCGCGSTSRDRIMHTITCPVWMCKDLAIYYDKNHPAPTEDRRKPYVGTSSLYPCTNWAHSNCRVRGADRTKYCRNCLAAIGIYHQVASEEKHLGGVRE